VRLTYGFGLKVSLSYPFLACESITESMSESTMLALVILEFSLHVLQIASSIPLFYRVQ
jgi:hypothetical protein